MHLLGSLVVSFAALCLAQEETRFITFSQNRINESDLSVEAVQILALIRQDCVACSRPCKDMDCSEGFVCSGRIWPACGCEITCSEDPGFKKTKKKKKTKPDKKENIEKTEL